MDIDIRWLVSDRLGEVVMPKSIDTDTAKRFDPVMCAFLDQVDRPVHFLVELTHVTVTAPVSVWTTSAYLRHRHLGPILTIGLHKNPMMSFMTRLITRAVPFEIVQFKTRAEALAWLDAKGISLKTQTHAS